MNKNDIILINDINSELDGSVSKATKIIEEANSKYNFKLLESGYCYHDSVAYGKRMYYKTDEMSFVNNHCLLELFDVEGNRYTAIIKKRVNGSIVFCDIENESKCSSRRYVDEKRKSVIGRYKSLIDKNTRNCFNKREHELLDHIYKFSIIDFCNNGTLKQKAIPTKEGKEIWQNTPYAKNLRRTEELNHLKNLRRKVLAPIAKSKEEKEMIMRRHK